MFAWENGKDGAFYIGIVLFGFFLTGAAFVFAMDYMITLSGKVFQLTTSPRESDHSDDDDEDDNCDKQPLLIGHFPVEKVPL